MAKYLSIDDLKEIKIFFMAGEGPDSNKVYGQNKCLFPIKGKPVIEYMLDVFYDIGSKNIYMVGDKKELKRKLGSDNLNYIDCCGNLSTKVSRLLNDFSFSSEEPILVVSGDTPLFNKKLLHYFIGKCDLDKADFFHPLVPRENIEYFNKYFKRGYISTRDIDLRVNCMNFLKPAKCDFRYIQDITDNRKIDPNDKDFGNCSNPKNLLMTALRALGFAGLLKVAVMRSTLMLSYTKYNNLFRFMKQSIVIDDLEKYCGKIFKTKANAIISPYAEGTLDIDSEGDADVYRNKMNELENLVRKEHEMIELFENNAAIISSITPNYLLSDSISSDRLYHEINGKIKHPLRNEFKKEYHLLKRLLMIYSKKRPKTI